MILLAALLAIQEVETQEAWIPYFRYLARHQTTDGAWGAKPEGCVCPDPGPPPKADPAALLLRLGDDDPAKRDAAEGELRALGESALPALRAGAEHKDPEIRTRCARLAERLAARCTGVSDLETTALAVLAFLGGGFSHLSKDAYDGLCFGTVVGKGLQWLLARQDAEGFFDRKDAAANAVAALALSEAYGLTGSALFKEAAQRGVTAVEQSGAAEGRARAWTALVLISARDSGLEGAHAEQAARLVDQLQDSPSIQGVAARARLRLFLNKKDPSATEEIAARSPEALDLETRFFAAPALRSLDGPAGPRWEGWNPRFKDSFLPFPARGVPPCERGSREGEGLRGRLRATALSELALQVYRRGSCSTLLPRK